MSRLRGDSARGASEVSFWRPLLLWAVVPPAVVILVVNLVWGGRIEPDPMKRIEDAMRCRNFATAEAEYRPLIAATPLDIELHRGYLNAHFARPKRIGKHEARDDAAILKEYEERAGSRDPQTADIGHYGLGFAASLEGDHERAIRRFERVRDRSLPYLNNSLGFSLRAVGRDDEAEARFKAELALGGYAGGATRNLASLLFEQRRLPELRSLIARPGAEDAVPWRIRRYLALAALDLGDYAWRVVSAHRVGFRGLVGATLILVLWFLFVRRIDPFQPEPLRYAAGALIGGMLASLLATPLYDALDFGLGFRLDGRVVNDLAFSVLGIGAVEELVKLIPVLIVIRFTRVVDETVDYFVYASLSGLGFAFRENLLYFSESGLASIIDRGLLSVPMHMALTSLAVYGLFYARYRSKRHPLAWLAVSFAGACAAHGAFDFWLVAKGWPGELAIMSTLVLVYILAGYHNAIQCALNLSEHGWQRTVSLIAQLSAGIGLTFAIQYAILAASFGVANANRDAAWHTYALAWFTIIVVASLGHFAVRKGEWVRLVPKQRKR